MLLLASHRLLASGTGRQEGAKALPSPGDVGSFVLKLAEGLRGQTWAADWVEELQEADQQKEQTYRWVCGERTGKGFSSGL